MTILFLPYTSLNPVAPDEELEPESLVSIDESGVDVVSVEPAIHSSYYQITKIHKHKKKQYFQSIKIQNENIKYQIANIKKQSTKQAKKQYNRSDIYGQKS